MKPLRHAILNAVSLDLGRDCGLPGLSARKVITQVAAEIVAMDDSLPLESINAAIHYGAIELERLSEDDDECLEHLAAMQEPYRTIIPAYARRVPVEQIAARMDMTPAEVRRCVVKGYAALRMRMRTGLLSD
jgi:hypothetical protein